MQIYDIQTTLDGRELTQHGDLDFPCAFYDERFSEFVGGEVPWHWHDEIEVVLVMSGETQVECVDKTDHLKAGELIVINSGALHRLTQVGEQDCHILNVVFHPKLLCADQTSRVYTKYVAPITNNHCFVSLKLDQHQQWQCDAIARLHGAFMAMQTHQFGYELSITHALTYLWQSMCQRQPSIMSQPKNSSLKAKRIHDMLHFIDLHFATPLTVKEIGESANVSESECYRLFRDALQSTPNQYHLQVKLRKAQALLKETDLNVTTIAFQSGFSSAAYFTKKFRQQFEVTPSQYRRTVAES